MIWILPVDGREKEELCDETSVSSKSVVGNQLNEICGTAMDYATLTADQQAGVANLLGQLTERERLSWTSITAKALP